MIYASKNEEEKPKKWGLFGGEKKKK